MTEFLSNLMTYFNDYFCTTAIAFTINPTIYCTSYGGGLLFC